MINSQRNLSRTDFYVQSEPSLSFSLETTYFVKLNLCVKCRHKASENFFLTFEQPFVPSYSASLILQIVIIYCSIYPSMLVCVCPYVSASLLLVLLIILFTRVVWFAWYLSSGNARKSEHSRGLKHIPWLCVGPEECFLYFQDFFTGPCILFVALATESHFPVYSENRL